LRTISPSPRGEYVNETTFVTSAGAFDLLRLDRLPEGEVSAVAMSTDGLRMKILDDVAAATPYGPFFEDIFTYACSDRVKDTAVAAFIDGLADQTGDDKTLVVAVKREASTAAGAGDAVVVLNDFLADARSDAGGDREESRAETEAKTEAMLKNAEPAG
jgi:hypothetical protein